MFFLRSFAQTLCKTETVLFYAVKKARSASSDGHADVVICRFIFLGEHFYLLANPANSSAQTVINSDPVISSTTLFL